MPIATAADYQNRIAFELPSRDAVTRPILAQVITQNNVAGGTVTITGQRPDTLAVGSITIAASSGAATIQTALELIFGVGNCPVVDTSPVGLTSQHQYTVSFPNFPGLTVGAMGLVDNSTGMGSNVILSQVATGRTQALVNQHLNAVDRAHMVAIWPMYADRNLIDPEAAVRGPYLQALHVKAAMLDYLEQQVWEDITYANDGLQKSKDQYSKNLDTIRKNTMAEIAMITTRSSQNRSVVVTALVNTAPSMPRYPGAVDPNDPRFRGGDVGRWSTYFDNGIENGMP